MSREVEYGGPTVRCVFDMWSKDMTIVADHLHSLPCLTHSDAMPKYNLAAVTTGRETLLALMHSNYDAELLAAAMRVRRELTDAIWQSATQRVDDMMSGVVEWSDW